MLWGGRFEASPHSEALRLTSSIGVDMRLLEHDVAATKAHARALAEAGLLGVEEVSRIANVLDELVEERSGASEAAPEDEDVHSFIERVLIDRLGETGARIHAGRSRNDLVATDVRLWCRDAARQIIGLVVDLLEVIAARAEDHADAVMPGYTHLQRAQPVSLGFHLLAHGFAVARDGRRFAAAAYSANVSAMGAGALAGTTLPLDPARVATELGFPAVFDNAMDAVSDRDFASDLVYAAALCGVHLSRLAEEIVLWTTAEFGFARLPDEWSTGSSMMPQKRNPDLAELVRGRSAAGIADATGFLALLKGLPLAYDRDLQEDKGFLFPAVDRVASSLEAMKHLLAVIDFDRERLADAARAGSAWATDLAESLVQRGVPFRDAHAAVGSLVAALEAKDGDLASASPLELQQHHSELRGDDVGFADPRRGLYARRGVGATHPDRIREQAERLRAAATQLARERVEAAGPSA
jgi:argininosuccinate lyase